jgi:hypothetical protein
MSSSSSLNVTVSAFVLRENGPMSWDFTEGGAEEGSGKRKSILNLPEPSSGGSHNPFRGMGMGASGPPKMPNIGGGGGVIGGVGIMGGGGGMGVGGGIGAGSGGMGGGSSMMGGNMGGYHGGYGGGGGDMGYGSMGGYGGMGGEESKSCVLLVYGLEPPNWNCDRVFNLLCQGGN